MSPGQGLPLVAVVGRPNVGKSSLVNRILGKREAIVQETPGVTRDRRSFVADWSGRSFEIVDTGGLEPGQQGLDAEVAEQARLAIDMADLILLVVDSTSGATEDDHAVARMLRTAERPVVVVANKVDDPRDEPMIAEFFKLGLGEPIPVSALHGRGSGDLLSALVAKLPESEGEESSEWASVAIVGRPNVGKSSILNALLGNYRSIVDSKPGTTRDPVDSLLDLGDERVLRIVDTAGMRRSVKIQDPIEYFSFLRSRRTLQRVDAAILVIDADEGATSHDQRIADELMEAGRACVVALNKWDLVPGEGPDRDRLERDIGSRLRFLEWAETIYTSARTKRGMKRLVPALTDAIGTHRSRVGTGELNRLIQQIQEDRPAPRVGGRAARVLYAAQPSSSPPTFVLFATESLEPAYTRYLERRLRENLDLRGTPVHIEVRRRTRREVEV